MMVIVASARVSAGMSRLGCASSRRQRHQRADLRPMPVVQHSLARQRRERPRQRRLVGARHGALRMRQPLDLVPVGASRAAAPRCRGPAGRPGAARRESGASRSSSYAVGWRGSRSAVTQPSGLLSRTHATSNSAAGSSSTVTASGSGRVRSRRARSLTGAPAIATRPSAIAARAAARDQPRLRASRMSSRATAASASRRRPPSAPRGSRGARRGRPGGSRG